jgi:O-antigen ligase
MHRASRLHRALLLIATVFVSSIFFSIAVNALALVTMAALWVGIMVIERKRLVTSTSLDWFFLAYVVAEILSTLFSVNPAQSLEFSKRVLLIGVVYFFASLTASRRDAEWYVAAVMIPAALVGLLGVLELLFADPNTTRRLGVFQFYMTTSELMMGTTLLFLPFAIHPKTPPRVRWACLLALIPILVSLYATVTRGAYLGAAAGILFISFIRNKRLLAPFIILVVLLFVFAPPYVHDRLASIVDIHHPENASRLMLWKAGLEIFKDYPLVGVGDIDLHDLFVQYVSPGSTVSWGHEHNVLLQILVTLGGLGFVAFVAMLARILIVEWRIYKEVKDDWLAGSFTLGSLAFFVGLQVMGLTEWSFGDQEVALLLWTTLGLTLALGKLADKGEPGTVST